jgi:hypothetical protein
MRQRERGGARFGRLGQESARNEHTQGKPPGKCAQDENLARLPGQKGNGGQRTEHFAMRSYVNADGMGVNSPEAIVVSDGRWDDVGGKKMGESSRGRDSSTDCVEKANDFPLVKAPNFAFSLCL